jgi:hypothetical protein
MGRHPLEEQTPDLFSTEGITGSSANRATEVKARRKLDRPAGPIISDLRGPLRHHSPEAK